MTTIDWVFAAQPWCLGSPSLEIGPYKLSLRFDKQAITTNSYGNTHQFILLCVLGEYDDPGPLRVGSDEAGNASCQTVVRGNCTEEGGEVTAQTQLFARGRV